MFRSHDFLGNCYCFISQSLVFTRAVLLHGRVMPAYVVCPSLCLSVCPLGVTLMGADHISGAATKVITRMICSEYPLYFSDLVLREHLRILV